MMFPLLSDILLLSLALTCCVLADLPDGPSDSMDERFDNLHWLDLNGGLNNLSSPPYTVAQWAFGTVPQACFDMAGDRQCDPHELEVFDVNYNDCPGYTNVICRCTDSPMQIWDIADDIGRVPVKARQWINHVGSFNAPDCSAYSGANHITILGNCAERASVTIHEVAHSLDGWAVHKGNGAQYSATREWKRTVGNDTCVPDNYTKSRWSESWAQVAVLAAYHFNVGSIWDLDGGVECMRGQMEKVIQQLEGVLTFREADRCDRHWPEDPTVCMGDRAMGEGLCEGLEVITTVERYPALDPEVQRGIEEDENSRMRHAEEESRLVVARKFKA